MMKRLTSLLISPFLILALAACNGGAEQEDDPEPAVSWLTDYDAALETSRESGRPILMNFTGSDWCPPCIRMKRDVLETASFREFAEDHLVLLELDFPRSKPQDTALEEQNEALANEFEISAFPTFVLVDNEGRELSRTGGYIMGGPDAFIAWIQD